MVSRGTLGRCTAQGPAIKHSQGHVHPRADFEARVETLNKHKRNGASRARTGDLLAASQTLSQLSYGPATANFSDFPFGTSFRGAHGSRGARASQPGRPAQGSPGRAVDYVIGGLLVLAAIVTAVIVVIWAAGGFGGEGTEALGPSFYLY